MIRFMTCILLLLALTACPSKYDPGPEREKYCNWYGVCEDKSYQCSVYGRCDEE